MRCEVCSYMHVIMVPPIYSRLRFLLTNCAWRLLLLLISPVPTAVLYFFDERAEWPEERWEILLSFLRILAVHRSAGRDLNIYL